MDIEIIINIEITNTKPKNKGTGAGGSKTNSLGKAFETKTDNTDRLLSEGFTKNYIGNKNNSYYLYSNNINRTVVFTIQHGLKFYLKSKYNIDIFRCPDEAYIIDSRGGNKIIKILEKKEQYVDGSVETKLWSGPSLKREYQLVLGNSFEVHYAYCVSSYLKNKIVSTNKKYIVLNQILKENNIEILYGDDEDYFINLDRWINSS